MKGYYKQPQLTRQTLVNGWLQTGDLGRFDRQGNLFIVGRIKDVILSGGYNINPAEIEECILKHPAVGQAVVVAKKDKFLQETPCAFVVKNNTSEKVAARDILKWCRLRLSSYKVPRFIALHDRLPTLTGAKIDRNRLKEMANWNYNPRSIQNP